MMCLNSRFAQGGSGGGLRRSHTSEQNPDVPEAEMGETLAAALNHVGARAFAVDGVGMQM